MSLSKILTAIFAFSCLSVVDCEKPLINLTAIGVTGNASTGIIAPGANDSAILPGERLKFLPQAYLIPRSAPPLYLNRVFYPDDGQPLNVVSLSRPVVWALQAFVRTTAAQGDSWLPREGITFWASDYGGLFIVPAHDQSMSTTWAAEVLFGIWEIMTIYGAQSCTYQVATDYTVPVGSIEVFVIGPRQASIGKPSDSVNVTASVDVTKK